MKRAGLVVYPVALGDARHHPQTFGGAFEFLVELAQKSGAEVRIPEFWPNRRAVLDFVSNRRMAEAYLNHLADDISQYLSQAAWVASLNSTDRTQHGR